MDNKTVEILKPGIASNMNSYWAMHYCSILETLYEQKTMQHGFQKGYFNNTPYTLENLASKAGHAFFNSIKQSIKNFGLQSLLCHYLTSSEGSPVFFNIMTNLSNHHNYGLSTNPYHYGVFISCKDFSSGFRFIQENNPILLGFGDMSHQDAANKVTYADLCFLLKGENRNLAILGEVEGNKGGDLLLKSFWNRKKGEYYSFGIGVKQRTYKPILMSTDTPEPSAITGQWVQTELGWKYIVIIDSDHYLINDFHSAIDTIHTIFTLGPGHGGSYKESIIPILNLVRDYWEKDVTNLINQLRSIIQSDKFATLGTNPISASTVPSIGS